MVVVGAIVEAPVPANIEGLSFELLLFLAGFLIYGNMEETGIGLLGVYCVWGGAELFADCSCYAATNC